jgi:hypothetical protein
MTSSDHRPAAGSAIDRIVELLDEDRLHQIVDDRVDAAVASFRLPQLPNVTHGLFHRVLGDFVVHVHEHGLPVPKKLSHRQALAEAIALLDAGYEGIRCYGYEGACMDAMDPELDGMVLVLSGLTEVVKAMEREKYVRSIFAEALAPLDWQDRCRVAETLLKRLKAFLPPELLRCTPAQLADEIPALIHVALETDSALQRPSAPAFLLRA